MSEAQIRYIIDNSPLPQISEHNVHHGGEAARQKTIGSLSTSMHVQILQLRATVVLPSMRFKMVVVGIIIIIIIIIVIKIIIIIDSDHNPHDRW